MWETKHNLWTRITWGQPPRLSSGAKLRRSASKSLSFAEVQLSELRSPDSRGRVFQASELLGFLFRLGDGDSLACVAHLEASEAAHRDILAQLADFGRNKLCDTDRLILDEGLL